MGRGIVPIRIGDILQSESDEIRFIVTGVAAAYETYTHSIPVPTYQGKQPYYAKATLCYFPRCSRSQGVDYTNTELDFKLGRVDKARIMPINNDLQDTSGAYVREGEARGSYRKWDNVKVIGERVKDRKIPKKMYDFPLWGIQLISKKRLDDEAREELPFGIVVTLKEMNGVNRIDNFIKNCQVNEWRVEEIDITSSIDVYTLGEQEITFDE